MELLYFCLGFLGKIADSFDKSFGDIFDGGQKSVVPVNDQTLPEVPRIIMSSPDGEYQFQLSLLRANDKYDAELMERLFNIEDTIFEVMGTENFNFEYLPAKYLNPKDVLSENYYIIFKG